MIVGHIATTDLFIVEEDPSVCMNISVKAHADTDVTILTRRDPREMFRRYHALLITITTPFNYAVNPTTKRIALAALCIYVVHYDASTERIITLNDLANLQVSVQYMYTV